MKRGVQRCFTGRCYLPARTVIHFGVVFFFHFFTFLFLFFFFSFFLFSPPFFFPFFHLFFLFFFFFFFTSSARLTVACGGAVVVVVAAQLRSENVANRFRGFSRSSGLVAVFSTPNPGPHSHHPHSPCDADIAHLQYSAGSVLVRPTGLGPLTRFCGPALLLHECPSPSVPPTTATANDDADSLA